MLPLDVAYNYSLVFNYYSSCIQFMINTKSLPWRLKVLKWTLVTQWRTTLSAMCVYSDTGKNQVSTQIMAFRAQDKGIYSSRRTTSDNSLGKGY